MAEVIVVFGLGFGDEGKGSMVDAIVRHTGAKLVVRYNGGPQAGHTVVGKVTHPLSKSGDDWVTHTFSQFGAGTMAGAGTHLAATMMVNPLNMLIEAEAYIQKTDLDPFSWTTIDEQCLLVTPYHVALNRLREAARGGARHGSCGQGIGVAREDDLDGHRLWVGLIKDTDALRKRLEELRERHRPEALALRERIGDADLDTDYLRQDQMFDLMMDRYAAFAQRVVLCNDNMLQEALDAPGMVVFEGAQGVLLDEEYGFHPHTTWSKTTARWAAQALGGRRALYVGVTRALPSRHGIGPFPTESEDLTKRFPDPHNTETFWQGTPLRVGYPDLALLRYAVEHSDVPKDQPFKLAVTHCDQYNEVSTTWENLEISACIGYLRPDRLSLEESDDRWQRPEATLAAWTPFFKGETEEDIGKALEEAVPIVEKIPEDQPIEDYLARKVNLPLFAYSESETAEGKTFV